MRTSPPGEMPHRNHGLFSDHYLDATLPERPGWVELAKEAKTVMREVADVLAPHVPSENEAQTESNLVRPVLRLLGHDFEVQPALDTPDGTKRPDYVFYNDRASLDSNKGEKLYEDALSGKAFAVGDAKYWERPLDVSLKGKGDHFSNRNPSFQIFFYMQHSGVEWGILTNGRLWRLYHRDSAHKLDRFYEVDLPELVEGGDSEAFLYFFAFFRRAAFEGDGEFSLRNILAESEDYARSVGDSLKFQVYEALRHIAQGFLDHPRNGLDSDAETLREIYDNSLITLYRMLFVLYAESRELLPVRESEMYRETYSLYAIKRKAARGRDLLPGTTRLWGQLRELFGIIAEGSPPLSVATFDGGLFDAERHPFLEKNAVGDHHLQLAVDKLSRVNGQFVDYRDLAERHLGTIYEGLLEYHLEALAEPEDGWTVVLLNEKGERKLTGAYYTPDFVVKHIVEKTIGPMLGEAVAGAETDEEKVARVLGLDVLDPSMGSGHFLVEATEYIARFLVELDVSGDEYSDDGEAELAHWKRRVAQSCVYGVDLNPLAVDLAKLSLWLATVAKDRPLSFLDHHLRCGNSLVGSRISELEPRTKKRRKKKADDSSQLSMLDDDSFRLSMSNAVGSMWLIEESPADTVEEVREQERLYEKLRADLTRRYARLADLATATNFGVEVDASLWKPLADYAAKPSAATLPQFQRWLDEARDVAEERRFFHWELEFPEVFFDRQGKPLGEESGFDVVVGNPPYVRQEVLGREMKGYFEAAYPETYHGVADLFVYFFGRGIRLLRRRGRLSYISANSWLRANYAASLRHLLREETTVEEIVDLGDNRVFADAPDLYPAIHIVRREEPPDEHTARAAVFTRGEGLADFEEKVAAKLFPISIHDQPDTGWQLGDAAGRRLFAKLMAAGKPLGEAVGGKMYYGIKTGLNEAFIIDGATRRRLIEEDDSSEEIIKPFVRGEDVRPWYIEDEGRWLIVLKSSGDHPWPWADAGDEAEEIFKEAYPAIHGHLASFEERLRKRSDKGRHWWELRSCDYYDVFEGPKIFWPDIAKLPRFSLGEAGVYAGNTCYLAPLSSHYLLGLLASRAVWFALTQLGQSFGERAGELRYRLFAQSISRLPIPDASEEEREAIGALAMGITDEARSRYALHERARRRVRSDFGKPGTKLNNKLTSWWSLGFPAFRAEIKKVFKEDIPLSERDDWEDWLENRQSEHERRTAEIVRLETELNERVNRLFGLGPEEIEAIEKATKYRLGEV